LSLFSLIAKRATSDLLLIPGISTNWPISQRFPATGLWNLAADLSFIDEGSAKACQILMH
jgi:hypothetical protein